MRHQVTIGELHRRLADMVLAGYASTPVVIPASNTTCVRAATTTGPNYGQRIDAARRTTTPIYETDFDAPGNTLAVTSYAIL